MHIFVTQVLNERLKVHTPIAEMEDIVFYFLSPQAVDIISTPLKKLFVLDLIDYQDNSEVSSEDIEDEVREYLFKIEKLDTSVLIFTVHEESFDSFVEFIELAQVPETEIHIILPPEAPKELHQGIYIHKITDDEPLPCKTVPVHLWNFVKKIMEGLYYLPNDDVREEVKVNQNLN